MKIFFFTTVIAFLLAGCSKMAEGVINKGISSTPTGQFIKYTIPQGSNYCEENTFQPIKLAEMKFVVKFDSSAVYQTQSPENQYDINKLYGFSDNNADHHQYSARFGWRWSNEALRLFAYIYNAGKVTSKELTTVAIGEEINCSIKIASSTYLFTVNGVMTQLPRMATTEKGEGYQLYPYFGGNETAPHPITLWIKKLI